MKFFFPENALMTLCKLCNYSPNGDCSVLSQGLKCILGYMVFIKHQVCENRITNDNVSIMLEHMQLYALDILIFIY